MFQQLWDSDNDDGEGGAPQADLDVVAVADADVVAAPVAPNAHAVKPPRLGRRRHTVATKGKLKLKWAQRIATDTKKNSKSERPSWW